MFNIWVSADAPSAEDEHGILGPFVGDTCSLGNFAETLVILVEINFVMNMDLFKVCVGHSGLCPCLVGHNLVVLVSFAWGHCVLGEKVH